MNLKNNFAEFFMEKDLDLRLIPKGRTVHVENMNILSPIASKKGTGKPVRGNKKVTDFDFGPNARWMGHDVDRLANKIRWLVKSDTANYIVEYDVSTDTQAVILLDDRPGAANVLNFQDGYPAHGMRVLNDVDNGKAFMFITDNLNEIKGFDIDTAKTLAPSNFNERDVILIKAPPLNAPIITLGQSPTQQENFIEDRFVIFACRYKFQNGEYSALSPFSEFAFHAKSFSYDYGTSTNKGMLNEYNKVDIQINTGPDIVVEVELIYKEPGSNTIYLVEKFNKSDKGWADNSDQTIEFSTYKTYRPIDSDQLNRIYDIVPTKAKALELIGNRLVVGNYTENYPMLDLNGNPVNVAMTVAYVSTTNPSGIGYPTMKSNRDYGLAVAYMDGKGRQTTPLTSQDSTVHIPNSVCHKKNRLRITMTSYAPSWATHYRFYLKENRRTYYTLAPVIFYREGVYAWLKVEGDDQSKIQVGDMLYVKSDTSGQLSNVVKAKVLEITSQPRNFLETDPLVIDGDETLQMKAIYFKVKASNFSLNQNSVQIYESVGGGFRSLKNDNNIGDNQSYVEDPIYYGGNGLNDMTVSGAFSASDDIRYEIEILIQGTPDTFRWRTFHCTTGIVGAWNGGSGIAITGSPQSLSNGISITFGATTGHELDGKWVVSAKSATRATSWNSGLQNLLRRSAIVMYMGKPVAEEAIKGGAVITIRYDDTGSGNNTSGEIPIFEDSFTVSRDYANLEEWFHGDNVITQLTFPNDLERVMFRRGSFTKIVDGTPQITSVDPNGRMIMLFLSSAHRLAEILQIDGRVRVEGNITIAELDNNIVFETIPKEADVDRFFELPYTYSVGPLGNHIGDVGAQHTLNFFNAFGWGNGFESNRIGDLFTGKEMVLDTKPLTPVDEYKEIVRPSGMLHSGIYEQTTKYNAINEFNASTMDFKDLDDVYGGIQKLFSRDTNLIVFQEDKTLNVPYGKNILYDAAGNPNLQSSDKVLGTERPYAGEYGIGRHPESFSFFGNRIYHLDKDRGCIMRLSIDGYTEISNNGLHEYIRNLMKGTEANFFPATYDPYNDVFLICLSPTGTANTLAFSEAGTKGFPLFQSFVPEAMMYLDNRMYSIKDGQLWVHDDDSVPINNFYGVQHVSKLVTVFNDVPSEDKIFKTLVLEATKPMKAIVSTNYAQGTLGVGEFQKIESRYFAYLRKNEYPDNLNGSAIQGIGTISGSSGTTITFGGVPDNVNTGDVLYQRNGANNEPIGAITGHTSTSITVDAINTLPVNGRYCFAMKPARIEGGEIRGNHLRVELEYEGTEDMELFAVETNAVKSYV